MRWATRALGLVSTVVLARLLSPGDFGVLAMAMVVVGFLEVFTHTGVDLALIRDEHAGRDHYDTAWTFEILQGAALAAGLVLAAPLAAAYFEEPRITIVMSVLSLRALIGGFENIGVVAFRRELTFDREFWFGVVKKMATVGVTVGAALALRSYWALVFGLVAGRLLDVLISFRIHPYRPRLTLAKFGEIWSFSRWLLVARIGNLLNRKLDEFIVGGQAGTVAMGYYFIASDIATAPTEEIVLPMSRGTFPVYSRLLDDARQLEEVFAKVLISTAYLCVAVGIGVASVAPELLPVVLGEQWSAAIPLMPWLGVSGVMVGLAATLDTLLLAVGQASLSAKFKWLQVLMLAPALVWAGQNYGLEGIAIAKMCVAGTILPLMFLRTAKRSGIGLGRATAGLWPIVVAGAGMYAGVRMAAVVLPGPMWLRLIFEVGIGAAIFLATATLLWLARGRPAGPEHDAGMRLMSFLRRKDR